MFVSRLPRMRARLLAYRGAAASGGYGRRMARRPDIEIAGGVYHVFARGNERRAIYRDDNDRTSFLELRG
jgi:hypothetical protein